MRLQTLTPKRLFVIALLLGTVVAVVNIWWLTLAALFAALALAWFAVAHPLESLARQADRLVEGDYAARNRVAGADTELGRIGTALNDLAAATGERATRDALTGLINRDHLEEALEHEFHRLQRSGGTMCVAMLDLDHFRRINDEFGHDAGDEVLREFARIMRLHTRASDLAARFGGEEFALVLLDANVASVRLRLESVRSAVAGMRIEFAGRILPRITVSVGVAEAPRHGETPRDILKAADDALQLGKETGRDTARVYRPDNVS